MYKVIFNDYENGYAGTCGFAETLEEAQVLLERAKQNEPDEAHLMKIVHMED